MHCFEAAIEAARIAIKYRTPVILLSDGYLANGSEPWQLPDVADLPDISVPFATEPNHIDADGNPEFWPYLRDPDTLARPWAIPGTPKLMHRIGGIEKEGDGSGNISYTPENHQKMVDLRAAKVAAVAADIPPLEVRATRTPSCASSAGARRGPPSTPPCSAAGATAARSPGSTSSTSTRCRRDLGDILRRYPKVLVPELNKGQLARVVRAEYLIDAHSLSKVQGLPFTAREIEDAIEKELRAMTDTAVPLTTKKDWTSDQEVRWCPGCGDYGILLAVQQLMPELGVAPENTVFVSGHRLLEPLPVLHEHLRDALDPRPRPGHRHRRRRRPARPRRVGHHR